MTAYAKSYLLVCPNFTAFSPLPEGSSDWLRERKKLILNLSFIVPVLPPVQKNFLYR